MPADAVIEPYFRVYKGEETNPYDEVTNMRFKRIWNLEMQWALFKDNEKYITEALDFFSKEGLDDFCGNDGVLKYYNFLYVKSNKSSIIELCDWLEKNYGAYNPFHGATRVDIVSRMNYNSVYTDIMLYKRKDVEFNLNVD